VRPVRLLRSVAVPVRPATPARGAINCANASLLVAGAGRLGLVGPGPRLAGLVCHDPRSRVRAVWGLWAPAPVLRGLCATTPNRGAGRSGRVSPRPPPKRACMPPASDVRACPGPVCPRALPVGADGTAGAGLGRAPVIVDRYLAQGEVAVHGNPDAGLGARIAAFALGGVVCPASPPGAGRTPEVQRGLDGQPASKPDRGGVSAAPSVLPGRGGTAPKGAGIPFGASVPAPSSCGARVAPPPKPAGVPIRGECLSPLSGPGCAASAGRLAKMSDPRDTFEQTSNSDWTSERI
jgi:hypothetical protein